MKFHPIIAQWFREKFKNSTEVQALAWREIQQNKNVLLSAPTGSGKTLAAFLGLIDTLLRKSLANQLENKIHLVYISPLKALSNDIRRNLEKPLEEINALALKENINFSPITLMLRTGDTTAAERAKIVKTPPHILVTTPETFFLMLTAEKSRDSLRFVQSVIVDEIHAIARDKRGSHLALSLARLDHICRKAPQRIGISATQKPMKTMAHFLCGVSSDQDLFPNCEIIDTGQVKNLDLAIELPQIELSSLCSLEQWAEIYLSLSELIKSHRSTLIFVNTRRLAERLSHQLSEILGEEAVTSHHGSLSKELRLNAEEKLKNGELKAIVATASLELGIDIGYIDLVCQIGSPRSIAVFLQRIGRSGHAVAAVPKGRIFPVTRDELMESIALLNAVKNGNLDKIIPPEEPLDILAQQIIAEVSCEEWTREELYKLCCRAWSYRNLTEENFEKVLEMLAEGISGKGAYIHYDRIHGKIRARRHARLAVLTSGGAIPENADYRVVLEDETVVGSVNEDFAIDSMRGDIFILGNNSWRILYVRGTTMTVEDALGAPATIPFWFGEALGRTIELSTELSIIYKTLENILRQETETKAIEWLHQQFSLNHFVASQAVNYISSQLAATGTICKLDTIIFERFFDESGGMQLVVHSPYGSRVNRAWGLAMRKRFCRSFNFELQAIADENGFLLSLGPQQSFPLEEMFQLVPSSVAKTALEQALLAVPLFQIRWRWNATRALAVLRSQGGKRVAPALQRFRADDLLTAVFPDSTACLEHIHGDIKIPYDHPLVWQTMHDCFTEALDLNLWLEVLRKAEKGEIKFLACDTTEPSPFSYQLIHANKYTFLDDAPAEDRRTRALQTRKSLKPDDVRDLAWMDSQMIAKVIAEAAPLVRNADELHDTLLVQKALLFSECQQWRLFLEELIAQKRVAILAVAEDFKVVFAIERWSMIREIWDSQQVFPNFSLPEKLNITFSRELAIKSLLRGRLEICGPVTGRELAKYFRLKFADVFLALLALENEGYILRGNFSQTVVRDAQQILEAINKKIADEEIEWCERRLLARIHRLTMDSMRRQIEPVEPHVFMKFLLKHQMIDSIKSDKLSNRQTFEKIIDQLEGFEIAAGAWESEIFPARMEEFKTFWLDETTMYGETLWCRLKQAGQEEETTGVKFTANIPIALALRANVPWLLNPTRNKESLALRSEQLKVYDILKKMGALFSEEIKIHTKLLPSQVDEILWELAARGLVIADGFAAVRRHLNKKKDNRPQRKSLSRNRRESAGRWNLFPGILGEEIPENRRQNWAILLLHRYGIIFRDLLTRESCAPAWGLLVPELRKMEARGEIRGGRFIKNVGGEQYALSGVVEKLRQLKEQEETHCIFISAVEPANLEGVINERAKVSARKNNTLCYVNGICIAVYEKGGIKWFTNPSLLCKLQIEQALQQNGFTRSLKKLKISMIQDNQPLLFE